VGQAGQILLRGVNQAGRLTARWQNDNGEAQTCSFDYQLKSQDKHKSMTKGYEQMSVTCTIAGTDAFASRNGT
jgi:outer membrane usher protein